MLPCHIWQAPLIRISLKATSISWLSQANLIKAMVTWCDHYNARNILQFCMFIQSPLKVWRHLFTSVGLSEVFMRGWIYSAGAIYRLHQQNVMGYLGTGTFSQRTGRDLPNPLKTHCEGDVALQGVFRWFLFWARQRRRKTKEKWLSDAPLHFSPVASLLLQHITSIFTKTFKFKIQ